jgi:transposase
MSKKKLFLGIDTASQENHFALVDSEGQAVIKDFRLANSLPGAEELVKKLLDLRSQMLFEELLVGTEATNFYDWHLLEYLAQSTLKEQVRLTFYRLNARLLHNFKKSYPYKGKDDRQDSRMIAERLRIGNLKEPYTPCNPFMPLQRLTRFRLHVVETLVKETAVFLQNLSLKFSSFQTLKPFSHPLGKTSTAAILEFKSSEDLIQTPLPELVSFLMKQGKNRFPDAQKVATTLKQVARESYRLRPELGPTIDLILSTVYNNIQALRKSLKEIDHAIEAAMQAFPCMLSSIPGFGPVYSAGILAEIQDIRRFPAHPQLAQFAGITWSRYESGNFKAEETRLMKQGNKYLRYYLIEAANSVRVHAPEFQSFYQRKFSEVTKHCHKRALVLTARKLIRLVHALLRDGRLYQPGQEVALTSTAV